MIISRLFHLAMRMFQTKCAEKITKYLIFNKIIFNSAVYEIMLKNTVELERPRMPIWCMRIACSVTNATNTHSQYVTLTAFPLQQLLHKRTSILRYTYIACLV